MRTTELEAARSTLGRFISYTFCGSDSAVNLLSGNLVGGLGGTALGDLEGLLDLLLDGLLLLLDGRGDGLGAALAVEVAGQVGARRQAAAVLGDEVIEGSLEVALLEALVAKRRMLENKFERRHV